MPPFLEGGGVSISEADLVLAARLGDARAVAEALLLRRLCAARAEAEGVEVTDEELEEARGEYFADLGVMEEEGIQAWLRETATTEADLRKWLRENLLGAKLRKRLVPDAAVEDRYRQTLHDHATVRSERILLPTQGMASELLLAVRERECDWSAAVERAGGMESLELARRDAPADLAPTLFSAAVGDVVGPSEADAGGFYLHRVLARTAPRLDDALRDKLRDELFQEEIRRPLARKPPRFV